MTHQPVEHDNTLQPDAGVEKTTQVSLDLQWEKEVERDLMLLLQSWNTTAAIESEQPPIDRSALLKSLPRLCRQPVYFPLGGKVEAALGDALAQADGMFLFECKKEIDRSEWAREALAQETETLDSGDSVIHNKGGKNRKQQLTKAGTLHVEKNMQEIANKCHMLVASSGYQVIDGDTVEDGLCYTLYWPFVMSNDMASAVIDLHPVDELRAGGADLVEFYLYVHALIDGRKQGSSTDAGTLQDQLIVLAKCGRTWSGYRMTQTMLIAALRAAADSKHLNKDKKQELKKLVEQANKAMMAEKVRNTRLALAALKKSVALQSKPASKKRPT